MLMRRTFIISLLLILGFQSSIVRGQNREDRKIINLFGQTVNDSMQPIPYVHIILHNKNLATASDVRGYFSFPAEINDTLVFRAVGYKYKPFVVQDTFDVKYPSIEIVLEPDTVQLRELTIYPWQGDYERFKQAILAYELPMTDLDRAYKNLAIMDIQSVL